MKQEEKPIEIKFGKDASLLHRCGDAQTPGAWCGELARVDVGNLPHGSIHVLQVFALHHQNRLGRIKVELRGEKTGGQIDAGLGSRSCEEPEPRRCRAAQRCANVSQ